MPCSFIFYCDWFHGRTSDGPKWQFLKMSWEVEEEFSRCRDNSDKVSDKELQSFESFHCTNVAWNTRGISSLERKPHAMGIAWGIVAVPFTAQVESNLQTKHWLRQNRRHLTANHSYSVCNGADCFTATEAQSKVSAVKPKVTLVERLRKQVT